ncbi:mitochondrial elongation factor MEF2 PWA37_003374 [Arxiozyma heterogenica]|uniref:Ribosome-releasing factor 2, mitochondrial n=1 Tax=Arxiozyma heterogenica TaxID=278026 RepID=A0AAN7WNR0_9SACH|nr:hypothetical protein RI543_001845 [Kazachstania heterogenica]
MLSRSVTERILGSVSKASLYKQPIWRKSIEQKRYVSALSKIRNIGIVAHIDAGKTTTTERLLYYSGKINRMGDVDTGDTTTDFLPQERSRGITIQSAAISFPWGDNCAINLIDTPGHADFCFEVMRTLKVLDGCVTILDGVAGVESQTEKVWKLSHFLPKICFINKMDRMGANFNNSVKSIAIKLHTRPIIINFPVFNLSENGFNEPDLVGVIDVVNQVLLQWDSSIEDTTRDNIKVIPIKANSPYFDDMIKCRESLVETLTEFDEDLLSEYIDMVDGDCSKLSSQSLNKSIRLSTLNLKVSPVLCGSSFKKIGVQPLLDAIRDYLPSPLEARVPDLKDTSYLNKVVPVNVDSKNGLIINNDNNLCMALAFKIITDPIRGTMYFVRVYSGVLRNGSAVYNSSNGQKIRIGKLVKMNADKTQEINYLSAGEIGVLTGSSIGDAIATGDTLVSHSSKKDGLKVLKAKNELGLQVYPITIPPPVFSVVVEPQTLGNKDHMEYCLKQLITEDPSLQLSKDNETGQTILSGMGELHLEIASDRLINGMGAKVHLGKLSVSYKESLKTATPWVSTSPQLESQGYHFTVRIEPLLDNTIIGSRSKDQNKNGLSIPLKNDNNFILMEKNKNFDPDLNDWKPILTFESIVNSIVSSALVELQRGGKVACLPLFGCIVRVKDDWKVPLDVEKPIEILHIIRSLIQEAIKILPGEQFNVLEPIMNLTLTVNASDIGRVSQDLTSARNANILSIEDSSNSGDIMKDLLEFSNYADAIYFPKSELSMISKDTYQNTNTKVIKAEVPLQNMLSYNRILRSLTQGRAEFSMEYNRMKEVNQNSLTNVLKDM